MNVLAICGSLRPESSNMSILKAMAGWLPAGINYHIYDHIGKLPHFDPTLNHQNIPLEVVNFRKLVDGADGIVICSPEYAFGIPGSLKNALDWTVATGEFTNKPVAIITASSSGDKAHAALIMVVNVLTGHLPLNSTLLIPYIRTKIDVTGRIDDHTVTQLHAVIQSLLHHMAV